MTIQALRLSKAVKDIVLIGVHAVVLAPIRHSIAAEGRVPDKYRGEIGPDLEGIETISDRVLGHFRRRVGGQVRFQKKAWPLQIAHPCTGSWT